MNSQESKTPILGLFILLGIIFVSSYISYKIGSSMSLSGLQKDAVESGAAYWCVVDHEKQFSWIPCENK